MGRGHKGEAKDATFSTEPRVRSKRKQGNADEDCKIGASAVVKPKRQCIVGDKTAEHFLTSGVVVPFPNRQIMGFNFYNGCTMLNEDEIAEDYPLLPAYYESSWDRNANYIQSDMYEKYINEKDINVCDPKQLPRKMIHDWSLYDVNLRLISLELLPMKHHHDYNVIIYGSGIMTEDDGGFCFDRDYEKSSLSSSVVQVVDGTPVLLSAIKEWEVEVGASIVSISIRTDKAWYRLGKPSTQYAPWYKPVLQTAMLGISIIMLLEERRHAAAAHLSFFNIVDKVYRLGQNHSAFVAGSPAAVERYLVVHGRIIWQLFAGFPNPAIKESLFLSGLVEKMGIKHPTEQVVKKKLVTVKRTNFEPQATTTRLVNRIWREHYSDYSPEDSTVGVTADLEEDEDAEEDEDSDQDEEDAEEEEYSDQDEEKEDVLFVKGEKVHVALQQKRTPCISEDIKWEGEQVGKTCHNEALYKKASVYGKPVVIGDCVLVEKLDTDELSSIYFVEYMFEKFDGRKMIHGRFMLRGSQTILGNAANEREVFLTNECLNFELGAVKEIVLVNIWSSPWGYEYGKGNSSFHENDRARAEERKSKGLPLEYYCRCLYSPDEGAFFRIQTDTMGIGSGVCYSCKMRKIQEENQTLKVNLSKTSFTYKGAEYNLKDFVYVSPSTFAAEPGGAISKRRKNVGLKPHSVCQLLGIEVPKTPKPVKPKSVRVQVRRFFRPEDICAEKAYHSDIREVYYTEVVLWVTLANVQGKCEVRKKQELPTLDGPAVYEHLFFCAYLYNPSNGGLKKLPAKINLTSSKEKVAERSTSRKKKGKSKGANNVPANKKDPLTQNRLNTLDIFAGCGGLTEGLKQSGVSVTRWAIERENPAGEAFSLNHPEAMVIINDCNVILRAIMSTCGDEADCISTPTTTKLAEELDKEVIKKLPRPGDVDFIIAGPPCQGFSGLNRFADAACSKTQREMIPALLSYVDYFRPRYFLLENVRNFVSFNKGQAFRLTLSSLLEMGYQVRFGILEAGAYGVSQNRKRAFVWAVSPEERLPEWPEPMHVFDSPELNIKLDSKRKYAAMPSTRVGAPFRSVTVRDTIGDLPPVENGASETTIGYTREPISWFQRMVRGDSMYLTDHVSRAMNELNLIRCQRVPKRPGANWRDLPDEKVKLSTGKINDLVPQSIPSTAKRNNQWKGMFGRLDWEGSFPTSVTDPQPMRQVGQCFHPDQDRILTVREYARSQGFRDSYKFYGSIGNKHQQIGNAVPPPLAFALGRKLKEAAERKPCI